MDLTQCERAGRRSFLKIVWLCLAIAIGTGVLLKPAFARPDYPPVFVEAYHPKPGGNIDKALNGCTLCHTPSGPPLNPYGVDVRAALRQANTQKLTAAILHSIDAKDSDGDGATNGAEIAADMLPGDPASHPAVTGATGDHPSTPANSARAAAPFSGLKALLFPKHAQHPVVVHFPIALLVISLIFDALAILKRNSALTLAAYFNLLVAAITAPVAVVTGLLAWQFAYGGAPLKGTLLTHLILGITTTVLTWVLWAMRRAKAKDEPVGRLYLLIGLIAILVVSVTGHLGGDLSGING